MVSPPAPRRSLRPGRDRRNGRARASDRLPRSWPWGRSPALCRSPSIGGNLRRTRVCRPSEGRKSLRNKASGRACACFRGLTVRPWPVSRAQEGPCGGTAVRRPRRGPAETACTLAGCTTRRDRSGSARNRAVPPQPVRAAKRTCRRAAGLRPGRPSLHSVPRAARSGLRAHGDTPICSPRLERMTRGRRTLPGTARGPFRDDRASIPSPRGSPANWPAHSCKGRWSGFFARHARLISIALRKYRWAPSVSPSRFMETSPSWRWVRSQLTCISRSPGSAAASLRDDLVRLPELRHRVRDLVARQAQFTPCLMGPGQRLPVASLVLGAPFHVAAQVGHCLGRGLQVASSRLSRICSRTSWIAGTNRSLRSSRMISSTWESTALRFCSLAARAAATARLRASPRPRRWP